MTGNAAGQHPASAIYCGRPFTPAELGLIRGLAATLPTRAAIAGAVCDALGWHAPDGRRKDMTARVALGRMAADGLITLPPPRNGNGNGRHPRHADPGGQLALPLPPRPAATLAALGPVTISAVDGRTASRQWNQLIRDHHYLGYTPLAGAQIRYLAATPAAGQIAALAFAASAWKCAPRDTWIGWDAATRAANLNLICGNAGSSSAPTSPSPTSPPGCSPPSPAACPPTGGPATATPPSWPRPSSKPPASPAPATAPPTGPASGTPRAEANSTAATSTPCPSKTSTYTPCTGTGARSSPPRPSSDTPRDHRIVTIAARNGGDDWGPGAVPAGRVSGAMGVVVVAEAVKRRRSRQVASRPKVVQFSLTEEEFEEVSVTAARSGLARGAFAAEAALAAARGAPARGGVPVREAVVELMSAAGLVRRIGTNLNQAVARLNATGQRGDDLLPAAQFCARVIRRLDEAAEQLRRSVP